jgi:hypothetical protein
MPRDPEEVVYFEAPDHSAGAYFSTWQMAGQLLLDAMRDTLRIELRNLPATDHGSWEVLSRSESNSGPELEMLTEYFNLSAKYRIVSRLLGRGDRYVRLSLHDYHCIDPVVSAAHSSPIVASLVLVEERQR